MGDKPVGEVRALDAPYPRGVVVLVPDDFDLLHRVALRAGKLVVNLHVTLVAISERRLTLFLGYSDCGD